MLCSLCVCPCVVCSPPRVCGLRQATPGSPPKFPIVSFFYKAAPPPFPPTPRPADYPPNTLMHELSPAPRNTVTQLSPFVFSLSLACAILTIFLLTCHSGIRAITLVPHWPAASLRKGEKKSHHPSVPLTMATRQPAATVELYHTAVS